MECKRKSIAILFLLVSLLAGCSGGPVGVEPVSGFEVDRYLGKWYEVARFDHIFERGLSNVTAEYRMLEDGRISVTNEGYDEREQTWKQVEAVAEFTKNPDIAQFRVTFFGPIYGGYNIIELDHKHYGYALVAGHNRSFLWVLSRTKTLPMPVLERLLEKGRALGFPVEKLIFVAHNLER